MTAFTDREQAAARAESEKDPSGLARGDASVCLDSKEKAVFVRSALALALLLLSSSAMNTAVFPLFDGVFTYARDVSVFANAVFLVAVGLWASFSPGRLRANAANTSAFVLFLIGGILLPVALVLESAALLVVSSCVLAVARGWASLCVGLFLPGCRPIALFLRWLWLFWRIALSIWRCGSCPDLRGCSRLSSARRWRWPFLSRSRAMSWRRPVRAGLLRIWPSRSRPRFCRWRERTLVCLFLFRIAFGYSLRFFEHGGVPLPGFVGAVPVVFPCCSGCRVFPWSILARSGNAALGSSRAGRLFRGVELRRRFGRGERWFAVRRQHAVQHGCMERSCRRCHEKCSRLDGRCCVGSRRVGNRHDCRSGVRRVVDKGLCG